MNGPVDQWSPASELLLMTAARVDHVERVIAPALRQGKIVLCDRFIDSTRVYQGEAGGVGRMTVDRLHDLLLPKPRPGLTILLDLAVEVAAGRWSASGARGRFEAKGRAYHEQVRQGFLAIAAAEPERIAIIDAREHEDIVAGNVLAAVQVFLGDSQ